MNVGLFVGSLIFHFASPWYFTPLASNWGTIDFTVDVTFWVCGIVFVLDGVLIGAGDGRYLAWVGVVNLVVFLPLAALVVQYADWHTMFWVTSALGAVGVAGVWWAVEESPVREQGRFDVLGATPVNERLQRARGLAAVGQAEILAVEREHDGAPRGATHDAQCRLVGLRRRVARVELLLGEEAAITR